MVCSPSQRKLSNMHSFTYCTHTIYLFLEGWVPAFWLGLNSPDPVSCLNAACDGLLFWDDGTPYTFVGGIFNHVLFHPQAGAGGILLPNTGNPLGSLLEHRFLSTKLLITVCQVDCHPESKRCHVVMQGLTWIVPAVFVYQLLFNRHSYRPNWDWFDCCIRQLRVSIDFQDCTIQSTIQIYDRARI